MSKKYKKKDLGKGIRALLTNIDQEADLDSKEITGKLASSVAMISLNAIEVNPFQPRNEFDAESLNELAESIKTHGLIQPITVRRTGQDLYQLISGERRLRASKIAGLKEVPAYIRLANDQEMLEMALVENIQREDLNAVEISITYQRLVDECGLTHEDLSERVGKNRSTITNYLRLLKLPPEVQQAIKDRKISMGHARALLGVDDVIVQLKLVRQVIDKELSVRDTEKLIRSETQPAKRSKSSKKSTPQAYLNVEKNLRDQLGSRVVLKSKGAGKGQIVIPFDSDEDLNRILELIEE